MKSLRKKSKLSLALATFLAGSQVFACGPSFPNTFLNGGDALLAAPYARFAVELERLDASAAAFTAQISTNGPIQQSLEGDLADLRAALAGPKFSPRERDNLVQLHRAERQKLDGLHVDRESTDEGATSVEDKPAKPEVKVVPGLPREFADYFRGFIAFRARQTNEAMQIWEKLLNCPPAERHYRSTWAAYMLGRAYGDVEPEKAIDAFRRVRKLAGEGYADTLGLASASLGWEARANLKLRRYETAIELYLQQLASGDETAVHSLAIVASEALKDGPEALRPLAANRKTRPVLTAHIISHDRQYSDFNGVEPGAVYNWLMAVEDTGVKDMDAAEQLALAAYQSGQMELTERWLKRARSDAAVALWLQAKLHMRAGKVDQAAALLARVTRSLPIDHADSDEPVSQGPFAKRLQVDNYTESISSAQQALGELGVLRLARREYTQALDALLRSGFWMDAAYVAERVLTLDELKSYVDRNWPAMEIEKADEDETAAKAGDYNRRELARQTGDIRYLLGRRLTRNNRGGEARSYYPNECLPQFDELCRELIAGVDESRSPDQRAASLFAAATLVRESGMELLSTEMEPDWHVHEGQFQEGVSMAGRTNETLVIKAGTDELHRFPANEVLPERRYHYRYVAALLAWDAAKLMPNNSDETAQVLCTAGSWLKLRDPQAADVFYKALVRRCRKTALGEEADRIRWFPKVD